MHLICCVCVGKGGLCFAGGDADQRRLEGLFVRLFFFFLNQCTDWLFEGSGGVCGCVCVRSRSALFSHQIVNGSGSAICVAVFSFTLFDRLNRVINQKQCH